MNIPEGLSQEQVDEAIRITDASEKAYGAVCHTHLPIASLAFAWHPRVLPPRR